MGDEVDRLTAIEVRLAAATPGHWVAGIDIDPEDGAYWAPENVYAVDELPVPDYSRNMPDKEAGAAFERVAAWADAHERGIVAETGNDGGIPDEQHDANQRLIAHAPDDLRWLLVRVRMMEVAIRTVLADEEIGEGGWGPDITMATVLREALTEKGASSG